MVFLGKYLFLLLYVFTQCRCHIPLEDIDDVVDKFSAMTSTSTDMFSQLKLISINNRLMLNAIGTGIGPLFSAMTKMTGIAVG